jgi:hypothetical protein
MLDKILVQVEISQMMTPLKLSIAHVKINLLIYSINSPQFRIIRKV